MGTDEIYNIIRNVVLESIKPQYQINLHCERDWHILNYILLANFFDRPEYKDILVLMDVQVNNKFIDIVLATPTPTGGKIIWAIEFKYKNYLNPELVNDDIVKLKDISNYLNRDILNIATGFDPLNQKLYWETDNLDYTKLNFISKGISSLLNKINKNTSTVSSFFKESSINDFNLSIVRDVIDKASEYIFMDKVRGCPIKESQWVGEFIRQSGYTYTSKWQLASECKLNSLNSMERIDLLIYNPHKEIEYAIEFKGTYGDKFPIEMINGFSSDPVLINDFIKQSIERLMMPDLLKKRSVSPVMRNGKKYFDEDFCRKLYYSYKDVKRLSSLVKNGVIKKGIFVFADHKPSFENYKKVSGFTEEQYRSNFIFRHKIFDELFKLLNPEGVEFHYFYKFNKPNNVKELFKLPIVVY